MKDLNINAWELKLCPNFLPYIRIVCINGKQYYFCQWHSRHKVYSAHIAACVVFLKILCLYKKKLSVQSCKSNWHSLVLLFNILILRPSHWGVFCQCLHVLAENSSALQNSTISPEVLLQLISDNCSGFCRELHMNHNGGIHAITSSGFLRSSVGHSQAVNSVLWIPIDLYLEDCIDGSVAATSAIELLSGKDVFTCSINW